MTSKEDRQTEKIDKVKTIIGYFMLVFGGVLFIFGIAHNIFFEEEIIIKDVDCFDRYGNEIKGLVCEEKEIPINEWGLLYLTIGLVLIILSIIPFNARSWII